MSKMISRRAALLGITAVPLSLSTSGLLPDAVAHQTVVRPRAGSWQKYTVTNWIDGIGMGWCFLNGRDTHGQPISMARPGVRELRRVLQPGDQLWGRGDPTLPYVAEFAPPIPSRDFLQIFSTVGDHYGRTVSSLICTPRDPIRGVAMYFAVRHAKTTHNPGRTLLRGLNDCLEQGTIMEHYLHAWPRTHQKRARLPSFDQDITTLEHTIRSQGYNLL